MGIAIGSGTDIAIESGDIVLIKDDLMDSVAGVQLSKKVMGRVKQNLFWAFAYNVILIPVAAGILYPPIWNTVQTRICRSSNGTEFCHRCKLFTDVKRLHSSSKKIDDEQFLITYFKFHDNLYS